MKHVRYFEEWDWEHDRPMRPVPDGTPLPRSHAAVLHDFRDRPYRVIEVNPTRIMLVEPISKDTIHYIDYFYDEKGRIKEKRSLEADFDVCLIIRYSYDEEHGLITEQAWIPGQVETSIHQRRIGDLS